MVKHCPVRGCGALIRAEAALCSECWKRLPGDMQRAGFFEGGWSDDLRAEALAYVSSLPPLPTEREAIRG